MKKNVASQSIGAQMVTAADGTAFTGAVSVAYTIDNGTQTAGGGTAPAHEGNGYHSYTPAQAETNGDHIAFTFTGTGAIPATVQVYTTFPLTGDPFARLGAPAGASVSADIAAVKVDTAAILADTGTDGVVVAAASKTGYTLSSAGVQAIWDALTSALTTVGSIGKLIVDNLNATVGSRATQTSVDTVAGYVDTEIGTIISAVAAVQADTDNIQTRIPAALVGGRMDSSVGAIAGDTAAVTKLERVLSGNVTGTVGAASSTTSIVTSALDPAASVTDQYKGRIVTFDDATTTAALRGQSTDITASTVGGVLTVTALTTAPVSGDIFTVS